MEKKSDPKTKNNPKKKKPQKPKEDFNQAAFRTVKETIRRGQ